MEKPLKVRLHILSPVHIGCDDVYEPTSFVIDEKKGKLIEFDPMEFIRVLSPKDRSDFLKVCSDDKLLAIFQSIKRLSDFYRLSIPGREVEIASGLAQHYMDILNKTSLDNKTVINQFTMNKTVFNLRNNIPYISGTSFKGSLRTAYLSSIASLKQIKDWWSKSQVKEKDRAKELEEELLQGSFESDPLRMVKVSDFLPVKEVKTKIVYGVNRKKKKSEKPTKAESGPPQIFETIQPGAVFEGLVNIQQPLVTTLIKNPVEKDNLLKAVQEFYIKAFEKEKKIAEEIGTGFVDVNNFNGILGNSAFLIRIGRHSGAEAVTIEGNRWITIMQKKGDPPNYSKDGATTLWLASETSKPTSNKGLFPFGWALLEIIPFDIKNLYPEPVATIESTIVPIIKKEAVPVSKTIQPQTILWENASLSWSPGNSVLTATKDNKKAVATLGTDKGMVPESLHKKLFTKKEPVKANVTVEQTGNAFKILRIER